MSRTTICLFACAIAQTAAADELLLPTPDPISTPTDPCADEVADLSAANTALFTATQNWLAALQGLSIAQENLDDCLASGGACTQETQDLVFAEQLADDAQATVDLAAEDVDDASAALDECRCLTGGPGPPPPGSGDPPAPIPPLFAISDRGLTGIVTLLAAQ